MIGNKGGIILCIVIFLIIFIPMCKLISRDFIFDNVPESATLIYRACEPTGGWGQGEYYVFDSFGNRYRISQARFDSYKEIPRK